MSGNNIHLISFQVFPFGIRCELGNPHVNPHATPHHDCMVSLIDIHVATLFHPTVGSTYRPHRSHNSSRQCIGLKPGPHSIQPATTYSISHSNGKQGSLLGFPAQDACNVLFQCSKHANLRVIESRLVYDLNNKLDS